MLKKKQNLLHKSRNRRTIFGFEIAICSIHFVAFVLLVAYICIITFNHCALLKYIEWNFYGICCKFLNLEQSLDLNKRLPVCLTKTQWSNFIVNFQATDNTKATKWLQFSDIFHRYYIKTYVDFEMGRRSKKKIRNKIAFRSYKTLSETVSIHTYIYACFAF